MNALDIKDLSLAFQGKPAIESLSFSIPQGAFFSIIGPNGAGKSVLSKCILGLYPTQAIRVLGRDANETKPDDIGYVPQFKSFDKNFPAMGIHLVASGLLRSWPLFLKAKDRTLCVKAMESTGCAALADRPLRKLSGGELQRLYLARAFVRKPKILLLDEPATGIDVLGETDLYVSLEEYRSKTGTTIVLVTHDLDVARHHSTHVLLLNRRQIAFGSPSECLDTENIHRAFGHSTHAHCGDHSHA